MRGAHASVCKRACSHYSLFNFNCPIKLISDIFHIWEIKFGLISSGIYHSGFKNVPPGESFLYLDVNLAQIFKKNRGWFKKIWGENLNTRRQIEVEATELICPLAKDSLWVIPSAHITVETLNYDSNLHNGAIKPFVMWPSAVHLLWFCLNVVSPCTLWKCKEWNVWIY